MDKNSLSEYGWIIVIVIILAILIAFATPFGKFIVTSFQNTVDHFIQSTQNTIAGLKRLDSPGNISVSGETTGYILTFDLVDGADGYTIKVNGGEEITSTSNSVNITDQLEGQTGAVTIAVIATDSTGKFQNSPEATHRHRMPGLYQTGTYTLVKPWETLLDDGIINVSEGVAATCIDMDTGTNASTDALAGDLVISPDVTALGDYSFALCSKLTEVLIPNTVTDMGQATFVMCEELEKITLSKKTTSIPGMAFMQASSLKSINIPDSATSIGDYAFYGATNLESIYIGENTTSIGEMVFTSCGNLSRIVISPQNTAFHSYDYGNCVIETATKTLIIGCKGTVIPDDGSVAIIGASSFFGCYGLERINIPDSVITIEEDAFYSCTDLKSVTMSKNIKTIGDYAFRYCEKIKTIELPESLTSLGRFAFSFCSSLESIRIPSSLTTISGYAFQECHGLSEIVIPEGITTVDENAFVRCSGVKRISIASTVTNIANDAFFANTSLETISVADGNSVYHVQNECLIKTAAKSLILGCKNSIIPDDGSVTHIENYAFQECSGLIHMYIPKEITRIEVEAFKRCGYLETIIVEEGNPSYYSVDNCLIQKSGSKLRYGCKNSIIPSDGSVLTIENQAFQGCVGLQHVYIPAVIQDVDTHAFSDCINIETITVEAGNAKYHSEGDCLIETATKQVRLGCKNSVIPVDGSVTSVFGVAFADEVPMTTLVIPDSITSLNYNNFDDLIYLERVYLPGTLTEIKTYCFDGCINLKDFYFDGSIDQWNAIAKGSSWIDPAQSYTVHCIDGDVVIAQ